MIKKIINLRQLPTIYKQKQHDCARYTNEIKPYSPMICCIINSAAKLIII